VKGAVHLDIAVDLATTAGATLDMACDTDGAKGASMMFSSIHRVATGVSVVVLSLASVALPAEEKVPQTPLKVGISQSLFIEQPEQLVQTALPMWSQLVKGQVGIHTEFTVVESDRLAQQLVDHDLEMAVFPGYEFAWAVQEDRQLRALVIVVNEKPYPHAAFVVRQDAKVKDISDLHEQAVALHKGMRPHVRLYFERSCAALAKEPKDFFGRIAMAPSVEEALDDVVDGGVQAAVVDSVALESYQRRKPGRFRMLKQVAQSPPFPDPVICYRANTIDKKALEHFRDGMIKSDQNARGRQVLTLFKLTKVAKIPKDYDNVLREIAKTYPALKQATKPSTDHVVVAE
jgi:ABC-type phosphate/phosphonate transport system substrate-binding protein